MPVEFECMCLIMPSEKIEKFYPGGFSHFRTDNSQKNARRIWFDNYLVRDSAMSSSVI